MTTQERIQKFVALAKDATRIANSAATWEEKYDIVFSEHLSREANSLFSFDYYDPDTSYEEDVMAYVRALQEKADSLSRVLDELDAE